MTPLTRDDLKRRLAETFEPLGWTHALCEAGSAAFGRVDESSDIDLSLHYLDFTGRTHALRAGVGQV